jgi:hypothetical protein
MLATSGIIRLFGPEEKNQLGTNTNATRPLLVLMAVFLIFLLGVLAYQFRVVPMYSPYTN